MGLFEDIQRKIEEAVAAAEGKPPPRRASAPARKQQTAPAAGQYSQPFGFSDDEEDQDQYHSHEDHHRAKEQAHAQAEAQQQRPGKRESKQTPSTTPKHSDIRLLKKLLRNRDGVSALILGQEILGPPLSKRPPRQR